MEYMGFPDPVAAYDFGLSEITKAADQAGFETAWLADHFTPAVPGVPAGVFESWVSLAGMARETQNIRLGHMVNGNSYRHFFATGKDGFTLTSPQRPIHPWLGGWLWETDYAYGCGPGYGRGAASSPA